MPDVLGVSRLHGQESGCASPQLNTDGKAVSRPTVDNFATAKAPSFNSFQPTPTSRPQTFQHQSLRINKNPQISIGSGIWFGTRGPEVQILSPRSFSFNYVARRFCVETRPPGFAPDGLAEFPAKSASISGIDCNGGLKIIYSRPPHRRRLMVGSTTSREHSKRVAKAGARPV